MFWEIIDNLKEVYDENHTQVLDAKIELMRILLSEK